MTITSKFLFIISLFLSQISFSQETIILEGRIVDDESKAPLSRATILYRANHLGFTSNEEGEFKIQLSAPLTDSIEIRHLGYVPLTITIRSFLQKDDQIFGLVTDEIHLDEVVLEGQGMDVDVDRIMRRVYRKYNQDKPKKTHLATAYFRETGSYDGRYVFFNESTGYSLYLGKRSNAALFSNYKFFPEQSRISDIAPDFQEIMSTINSKGANDRHVGFSNNENNYRRFQEYGPLSRKFRRKFDYSLQSSYRDDNGNRFLEIHFTHENFTGYLTVNNHNLHIKNAVYTTDGLVSSPFETTVEGSVNLIFSYVDDVPFISELFSESNYQGLTVTNYLKIISQKFGGFDITADEYWGFNLASFHPYIDYTPDNWMHIPYYEGEDFGRIKKDLNMSERTLEQQFTENSGQWLNSPASEVQAASGKIEELRTYFE